MKLMSAKDDQDAIKQAHANCEDGCRLSKVERHMTVKESVGIEKDPDANLLTVDMLRGRVKNSKFAKLNSFRSYKVDLKTSEREVKPEVVDQGVETKEKQKVSTNPGPVDIKLDDKLTGPTPYTYFSKEKQIKNEEVKPELKHIRSKEVKQRNKEIDTFDSKVVQEKEEVPFDKPYKKVPAVVTDKSGATHTPMSRAKDLAKKSFKKIKKDTM
jgi:hypothetical protein